ncbi:TetR/AcrR family transcriptional regulator [Agromyces sp. Root81]|uniref:TetR/AcrR family transcriptional regulator n=1 Tax=Agromyces sp. Root81 TaxID=1736601 RepID=UPI0009E8A0C7|nr:TetR/AcrR family transcriptional regulator [Agromyces sp. Root81]
MSRSADRDRESRERSREAIITAAFELFGTRGYHESTIAQITSRAGVSQGLANYHFGGKEQLVAAVLDRWFAEFLAIAQMPGTADERLAGVIDSVLIAVVTALPQQRIILSLSIQPSTHRIFAEAERRNLDPIRAFEEAVRAIFRDRGADDPAVEEVMLRSVLEGVIVKYAIYGDTYPIQAARRWLYRTYELPNPRDLSAARNDADEPRLRSSAGDDEPASD